MIKNNKILFWATAGLVLALGVYSSVRVIMTFSGMGGAGEIRQVMLVPAPKFIPQEKIVGALDIEKNSSIYDHNIRDLTANIMKIPEVQSVVIKRQPSGKLYVVLAEKTPVAIWFDGGNYYPMTKGGDIIDKVLAERQINGLVFSGDKPKNAVAIIASFNKFPEILKKTRMIELVENRRWNIYTRMGGKIMLGEGSLEAQLEKIAKLQLNDKKFDTMDLRDANRTLVRP